MSEGEEETTTGGREEKNTTTATTTNLKPLVVAFNIRKDHLVLGTNKSWWRRRAQRTPWCARDERVTLERTVALSALAKPETIVRIDAQKFVADVLRARRETLRESELTSCDHLEHLVLVHFGFERRTTACHLVGDAAKRPQITADAARALIEHLW